MPCDKLDIDHFHPSEFGASRNDISENQKPRILVQYYQIQTHFWVTYLVFHYKSTIIK